MLLRWYLVDDPISPIWDGTRSPDCFDWWELKQYSIVFACHEKLELIKQHQTSFQNDLANKNMAKMQAIRYQKKEI